MNASDLQYSYNDFYTYLRDYKQPDNDIYCYDIYDTFTRPYYRQEAINKLIAGLTRFTRTDEPNLFRYPVLYLLLSNFKGLVHFSFTQPNFHKFLAIKLRVDSSTIVRYLFRCGYISEQDTAAKKNHLNEMEHYSNFIKDFNDFKKTQEQDIEPDYDGINQYRFEDLTEEMFDARKEQTRKYIKWLLDTRFAYENERNEILKNSEINIRDRAVSEAGTDVGHDFVGFYKKSKKIATSKKTLKEKKKK